MPDDPAVGIVRYRPDGDVLIVLEDEPGRLVCFSCEKRTQRTMLGSAARRLMSPIRDIDQRRRALSMRAQAEKRQAEPPPSSIAQDDDPSTPAAGAQGAAGPRNGASTTEPGPAPVIPIAPRRVRHTMAEGPVGREHVLDALKRYTQPIFVTGRAGTGKSTLLRDIATGNGVVVLAPTGIAALNAGGQTIHSFCKFPLHPLTRSDVPRFKDATVVQAVRTLIIDEVSMVRADVMDAIDVFLRSNRAQPNLPFGGVQILLFGDPYQLPPVVRSEDAEWFEHHGYESPHFFDAHIFRTLGIDVIALTKVYRQSDPIFVELLDGVRTGSLTDSQLDALNERSRKARHDGSPAPLALTARRNTATHTNVSQLKQLPGAVTAYEAKIAGEIKPESVPAERMLELKVGARVMFIKNSSNGEWVNGTLGIVAGLSEDHVEVRLDDGRDVSVGPDIWESIRFRFDSRTGSIVKDVVGSLRQLPLRLAWAVTIHKSQGLTLDAAVVDLDGGAFAPGQAYVALSRCRSFDGLFLRRPLARSDILIDSHVRRFMDSSARQAAQQIGAGVA